MNADDKIVKLARSAKRSGIKLPFNVIADALDQDHRYMGVRIGSTYKRLTKRGQAKAAKDVADNICCSDGRLAWPKIVGLIFLLQVIVGCSSRTIMEEMLGERLGESLTAYVRDRGKQDCAGMSQIEIIPENSIPGFDPWERGCGYGAWIDRHNKICGLVFCGEWEQNPKCALDYARKKSAHKIRLEIASKYGIPDKHFKVEDLGFTEDLYCKDGRYLIVQMEVEGNREGLTLKYLTEDALMSEWIEMLLVQQRVGEKIDEKNWQFLKDRIPLGVVKKIQKKFQQINSGAKPLDL